MPLPALNTGVLTLVNLVVGEYSFSYVYFMFIIRIEYFSLTVTDDKGAESEAEVVVIISEGWLYLEVSV